MIEATYIKPEDLANLETDTNGNLIIPSGIKIYINEPDELKILRLQEELNSIDLIEPSDEELIEIGRNNHPYYTNLMRANEINDELTSFGAE